MVREGLKKNYFFLNNMKLKSVRIALELDNLPSNNDRKQLVCGGELNTGDN